MDTNRRDPQTGLTRMKSHDEISKTAAVVREGLVILGETYQFIVSPRLFEIWIQACSDLDVVALEGAFEKLVRSWKPEYGRKFPAPGDLRALVDVAPTVAVDHGAEVAWITMLNAIMKYWHPDVGWRGPKLDDKAYHALSLAFGRDCVGIVWNSTNEERVWQKKDFVATYNRCTTLNDWTPLPELDAGVWKTLHGAEERPTLNADPLEEIKMPPLPPRLEHPPVAISAEEWEARKADQKRRLAQYAKEHGLKLENP